jgi:hypothetical protein
MLAPTGTNHWLLSALHYSCRFSVSDRAAAQRGADSHGSARCRHPLPVGRVQSAVRRLVQREPDAQLDYAAFFDPHTLTPLKSVRRGNQIALAVRIGPTRLIDNGRL